MRGVCREWQGAFDDAVEEMQFLRPGTSAAALVCKLRRLRKVSFNGAAFSATDAAPERLEGALASLPMLQELAWTGCCSPGAKGGLARLLQHPGVGRNVRTLTLASCELDELPAAICGIATLLELRVPNNRLKALPAALAKLHRLNRLEAPGNRLTSLPASLPASLTSLNLHTNKISELAEGFEHLSAMQELDLAWNK